MSQLTFKAFRRSCPCPVQVQKYKALKSPMLVFSQYINFFAVFVIINISSIFLAGWDFAIREPKYAKLNHSTLKTQLQLLLGVIHELSKGNIG